MAILKNSVFLSQPVWTFFSKKIALLLWKSVKGSWISGMGQTFDDYHDFQPKNTHPKHFSHQCKRYCLNVHACHFTEMPNLKKTLHHWILSSRLISIKMDILTYMKPLFNLTRLLDTALRCEIFCFSLLSFPQNERKIYKLKQLSLS